MLNTEFTVFWIKKFFEYSPGWIAAAVSICVIVLLGRWLRAHFTGYLTGSCAIFFFLYFFPVTAYIIANWCIEELVYWRMLWLLPTTVVTGYAAGLLYGKMKKKIWQVNIVLLMCLLVIGTGTCIYGWGDYTFVTNPYKIPQDVIDACDLILENSEEEQPLAAGDYDFSCYSRLYSADILQPYGRYSTPWPTVNELQAEYMKGSGADAGIVIEKSQALGVEYLVFDKYTSADVFEQNGYQKIGETDRYAVYRNPQDGETVGF